MQFDLESFKKYLVETGLVSEARLASLEAELKAKAEAGEKTEPLPQKLVSEGIISSDDLAKVQAHILGIELVDLKKAEIDFDTLTLIPEPVARKYNIIAIARKGQTLEVAMLDPDDLPAISFIQKKTGLKIVPKLTDTESMKTVLAQYQKDLQSEFGDIIGRESAALRTLEDNDEELTEEELKEAASDLPVVKIVDTLLKHAILQNASDIHIEPHEDVLLVRYRIDGILHDAMTLPKQAAPNITARVKVLANLKLDEKRVPQDGRFRVESDDGEKVSLRVSILPVQHGEKVVMRLLRENVKGFTLESLGFHGVSLERLHYATKQRSGMILTTGPTGSGKSTTLYTVLDTVNSPEVNISTVEDPVEYQMPRINQTQVKPMIGFTFASGLRSLMRQDPDVIMVGEIRDQETASLAVNAALTGHLVLSTLHTTSSSGAASRLVDMGIEPFLLSSTMKVVIGQRLVRRLAVDKTKELLTSAQIDELAGLIDMDRVLTALKEEKIVPDDATWQTIPFYNPTEKGETETGYGGRAGIHEVLKMSSAISDMIISHSSTEQIEEQARKEGMMTMLEDGIFKSAMGLTTIEEVLRVISE